MIEIHESGFHCKSAEETWGYIYYPYGAEEEILDLKTKLGSVLRILFACP